MNKYDSDYYVVFPRYDEENVILLKPDKKTIKSGKGQSIITSGRPLFFTNGFVEEFGQGKLEETVTDFMFDTPYPVVNQKVKEYLEKFKIDSLQIYPAVFIDAVNIYHENLWFLNLYSELDCWDRNTSVVDTDDIEPGEEPSIVKFSLNDEVLDRIPEENRLMFKMGGLSEYFIFIHKKIHKYLVEQSVTGVQLFPVLTYESGMEM